MAYEPSRLDDVAGDCDMSTDELRALLKREIERRRSAEKETDEHQPKRA
jgi:hypothetical protein